MTDHFNTWDWADCLDVEDPNVVELSCPICHSVQRFDLIRRLTKSMSHVQCGTCKHANWLPEDLPDAELPERWTWHEVRGEMRR